MLADFPLGNLALREHQLRALAGPWTPSGAVDVYPHAWLEAADVAVFMADAQGRPASAVMSFYFRNRVRPYDAGDAPIARELAANDFKYWELMRRACERAQPREQPLGVRGTELMEWVFPTRMFRAMQGLEGGETGVDHQMAQRGFENIGAWILGRNMFGPVRGPCGYSMHCTSNQIGNRYFT